MSRIIFSFLCMKAFILIQKINYLFTPIISRTMFQAPSIISFAKLNNPITNSCPRVIIPANNPPPISRVPDHNDPTHSRAKITPWKKKKIMTIIGHTSARNNSSDTEIHVVIIITNNNRNPSNGPYSSIFTIRSFFLSAAFSLKYPCTNFTPL